MGEPIDKGGNPFAVRFPAPHPRERVNGKRPSEPPAPARERQIVVDPSDWGRDATD